MILVIEDNEAAYEHISAVFGEVAVIAKNYSEAMVRLQENPEFVITDMFFPQGEASAVDLKKRIIELVKVAAQYNKSYRGFLPQIKNVEKMYENSDLLPLGILVVIECLKNKTPVGVASNFDHHSADCQPTQSILSIVENPGNGKWRSKIGLVDATDEIYKGRATGHDFCNVLHGGEIKYTKESREFWLLVKHDLFW